MRTILAALSLATLAACQTASGDTAPETEAPDTAEAPASLVGEYRVAGIDGTEVGGQIGIALSIEDERIHFEPRCAGFDWTYTYDGGALATDRPANRPTCRIAVHPEQQRLATALDAVTTARRTPSNGVELSGGGHGVTLFSQ
ncbi:hypothetical protein [Pelagerythrobacter sp.]|uniref:hypothetical protein n=1 Tax=Pelagerythrobacter sp. TaxID=2800702 RepID=UPI0035B125E3